MILSPCLFFLSDKDIVRPSARPFVSPSRYFLLTHWAEFHQSCYMTSLMVSNIIFSIRSSVRTAGRRPSRYLLQIRWRDIESSF